MAPLGNLVRLLPLHINEVPAHPALNLLHRDAVSDGNTNSTSPSQAGKIASIERPNVLSFMEEILDQAAIFVDDTLPATFKECGLQTSKPSTGTVQLLKRTISPAEVERVPWINSSIPRNWSANGKKKPGEAWFARRSRHVNNSSEGTANLDEFDYGLRRNHSKHEQEYTPDVFDSYKVLDWSEQIQTAIGNGPGIDNYRELDMSSKYIQYSTPPLTNTGKLQIIQVPENASGASFSRCFWALTQPAARIQLIGDSFKVYEMGHQLPAMLSNRVFSVLVLTAKRGRHSFVVVQIPIDIRDLTSAFYANGRNLKEGSSSVKRQKSVLGIYTSIESCEMLPDQNIEWVMATASDAKGWLPMWMQKMGVPSAVVKDVGLFIQYVQRRRPFFRKLPLGTSSEADDGDKVDP